MLHGCLAVPVCSLQEWMTTRWGGAREWNLALGVAFARVTRKENENGRWTSKRSLVM